MLTLLFHLSSCSQPYHTIYLSLLLLLFSSVIQIEHRFYGPYQPIMGREATVEELLSLLTPQQAMADMIRLAKHFKDELGCSQFDRNDSKHYCPVVTVGGSYPGFLSAMFRLAYSDFVDISYASSAPLKLYDQRTDQNVYYDIVKHGETMVLSYNENVQIPVVRIHSEFIFNRFPKIKNPYNKS